MGTIYKDGIQYGGGSDLDNSFVTINSQKSSLKDTLQNLVGNFAQIETNPTTYAHSQGDLLVFNGTLYKTTSSLSIGTVLTIGTNIISTNIDQNIIKPINIVNNATTNDSTKVASAAVAKNLQDQITTLNTNLNVKTGTITKAQNNSDTSVLTVRQSGNVVTIYGYITGFTFSTANTATTIATISNISLPPIAVRTLCMVGDNAYSVGTVSYLYMGTNGIIQVTTSVTGSNKAIYFNLTYVV